jgi:hypothetical protein
MVALMVPTVVVSRATRVDTELAMKSSTPNSKPQKSKSPASAKRSRTLNSRSPGRLFELSGFISLLSRDKIFLPPAQSLAKVEI